MKLSKRLKTICDFVPNKSKIIDVGADHALVDIYLTKEKQCTCLATDISKKCIEKANENIKKENLNIKTIVTDGINNIKLKDEIIIIAGMGTHNILKILNKKINNDLIISSHNDIPLLHKQMQKKGYHIKKEKVIYEKHFYVITYYTKLKQKRQNIYLTTFASQNKEYIDYLLKKYYIKYKNEKNIINKIKYKNIINKIKRKAN